jgi:membrane-bound lytic murein transglycosylase D
LENPHKYGFQLNEEDLYPPLEFDEVEVHCTQRTPIRLIAQAAGTYFKKIKDLNPDIRGYYLPEGTHPILVPKGAAQDFYTRYEEAITEWQKNPDRQIYVVKPGDNLYSIAAFYQVPLPAILIWNDLDPSKHIHPNDRLIIYSPIRVPEEERPE